MLKKPIAASMVEYIVLVVLLVGIVGTALIGLINTIYGKLSSVSADIGT